MSGVEEQGQKPGTAVILAAGLGSRLDQGCGRLKPLTKVLGVSLAERIVRTLRTVEVEHIIVTLGHEGGAIREHFTDIAQRHGLSVEFVEAEGWQRGNGASALAVKGRTGEGPFFLVMCDHLFDARIARALAADPPPPGEMRLAVDRDKDAIFDLDDVTRVRMENGRIVEIGKSIQRWDAADTGIMLCTSGLFEGLEKAAEKNGHGLSDGLRELAREGRAGTTEVTGLSWIDVDTPQSLNEAARRLMAEHGGKNRDGPVSRYLNRPFSRWLSRFLVRTPITPNQISLVSWVLSCGAALLLAVGGYPALAAGGALAQFASVIDGCDGEVARLKFLQSEFGGWFDAILDRYADAFLLFGLTWHVFSASGVDFPLFVGFAAIIGSFMNSYTADKYDGLMARKLEGAPYFRMGRDVRVFILFLGAVLNLPLVALAVIALVMNIEVVRRIVLCRHE